ncbi:hypothetical protein [Methylomicrobium sp. Wu6]|uniref:hypothetical protein n=1 Tax=Methylomicrobium sp. Wu6 TaxID=3107928 RepID=UPI002DD649CA|nr:hypothetical protein [Methylomicrobium sp. Wu6]MEC4747030.1 hypothetical protein [Methylomicrobium sp. Wu6]
MNHSIIITALIAALSLTACDNREPSKTVVNVPPAPAGAPGPAGPAGATGDVGNQGDTGAKGTTGAQGETGKSGEGTTVIVAPPAEPAK